VDVSKINMAGYDTLGACIFAGFGFAAAPETVSALVNARCGNSLADDRLPEWMTREPLPPHDTVFDVVDEELDRIFDFESDFL
jgi:aldehyde:ferredoxin oxidoreductase